VAQNVNVSQEKVAKTACFICGLHCGIDVHLRGNNIVKVTRMQEHITRMLCWRVAAVPDFEYSNQRLMYPLKKVDGNFKRISWDEALNFIVTKLSYIKEKYGPESLALYYGDGIFMEPTIGLMRLWAEAYGTPNICDAGCMCALNRGIANWVTFGGDAADGSIESKCVLNWGVNFHHSRLPARGIRTRMKEQGTKLIVIDPRVTHEAKMADLYLRPRPGTDWALALGFINVIISEELYDKDFVNKWTIGFDKLAKAVANDYTPEKVAEITSVPTHLIKAAAKMYATIKPTVLHAGVVFDQTTHAFQVRRAQAILIAITGNIDVEGGNIITPHAPHRLLRFAMDDYEYHKTVKPTFTADRYPLFEEFIHQPVGYLITNTILTGKPYPIKGFVCQGGNPLRTYPDVNKFRRALKELEFILVMDIFMTDLAELADIVLPAATLLERDWANSYWPIRRPVLGIGRKVLEPLGECWSDSKFWLELAKRMGYEKILPWKNDEEVLEDVSRSVGKTLKEMEELPQGYLYAPRAYKYYERDVAEEFSREYFKAPNSLKKGFRTPSGKVEIYSERLEKMGITPMPVPYEEPYESPVTKPELFKEYPLMALAGTRTEEYVHTVGHNIPRLRSRHPDPLLQINPKDAEKYGVNDGEWVIIESPKGEIKMKANVSEDMMEGLVSMPFGWGGESNVNLLTSVDEPGPVVGSTNLKGFACRVKKSS
jgi:anaerobic selenocysteine-containing dehydrogenase